jgi:hypothetical protein
MPDPEGDRNRPTDRPERGRTGGAKSENRLAGTLASALSDVKAKADDVRWRMSVGRRKGKGADRASVMNSVRLPRLKGRMENRRSLCYRTVAVAPTWRTPR